MTSTSPYNANSQPCLTQRSGKLVLATHVSTASSHRLISPPHRAGGTTRTALWTGITFLGLGLKCAQDSAWATLVVTCRPQVAIIPHIAMQLLLPHRPTPRVLPTREVRNPSCAHASRPTTPSRTPTRLVPKLRSWRRQRWRP
jgi:hypothetical protein